MICLAHKMADRPAQGQRMHTDAKTKKGQSAKNHTPLRDNTKNHNKANPNQTPKKYISEFVSLSQMEP